MILLSLSRRRVRHGLLAVVTSAVLAGSVAWTHSGMAMDHMGVDAGKAMSICLAVFEAGALAAAALAVAVAARSLRQGARTVALAAPSEWAARRPPHAPPARAGPSLLQVFRR